MSDPTRILIVDDDPIVADSLAECLADAGYATTTAGDGEEALDLLGDLQRRFDLLITDVSMPRCDGRELLKRVRDEGHDVVPIVVTGFGKIDEAVDLVKLGASDYLTKPVVDEELKLAVSKAAARQALLAENTTLRRRLDERFGLDGLIGGDYRMQKVYDLVEAVADSRTTLLVTGESGTGKTVLGRAVHQLSPRAGKPFVTFACGSIPETLLESELFGHVKGAFTGAESDKPGRLEAADGGTLFIDEINSATPALQLKLLRVLQERAFEPVGSTQTRQVDVRFVIAANRGLAELVKEGSFREDLYYRINVVNVEMPALRDRPGDIPLLAEHFVNHYAGELGRDRRLSDETVEVLQRYAWPGNVRELQNAMERAVVLSKQLSINPEHLPDAVQGQATLASGSSTALGVSAIPALQNGWTPMPLSQAMLEPERQILLAALEANNWSRSETARQLDINRTTLYKKIKQFRLDEPG